MLKRILILSIIACLAWLPASAGASVTLASLSSPSIQTLIGLGSGGVTVGAARYFDFGYVPMTIVSPTASLIGVQPYGSNGLRFVTGFSAIDGQFVGAVISYKVETTDPLYQIQALDLLSDGTAIISGSGTFASVTETARDTSSNVVGHVLSTFGDGTGGLIDRNLDTTSFPLQSELSVVQSLMVKANSIASGGGFSSLTYVDTNVVVVPEPSAGLLMLGAIGVAMFRRPTYKRSA